MTASAPAFAPTLAVVDGKPTTTSQQIAAHFNKRHDVVLRAIANLGCSPEFTARNFAASEYTDSTGRKLPAYRITRDGFVFLVMGFTGKDAARWKEAYIDAFNRMEAMLLEQQRAATPYSIAPGQTLSAEQAQTLRDMLQNAAQRLPKEKQGAFMVQG